MIQAIISDFSFTILFPKDESITLLNTFHAEHKEDVWYKILDYFTINKDILEIYKNFNWKKYIFTTRHIQEEPEIQKEISWIFDWTFIASELNISKFGKQSYTFLAKEIWLSPENILFIDDSEKNIQAARDTDMQVFLYKKSRNGELKETLNVKEDNLTLVFPNISHKSEYDRAIQKWWENEKIPTSPSKLFYWNNFEEFLIEIKKDRNDNHYWINSYLFFLMKDKTILWAIQIRQSINHPNLIEKWWHIWYWIAPEYRMRWYASKMLELGLVEARELWIKRVLITCDIDNIASNKVIQKNKWVFERVTKYGEANRYWIDIW